MPIIQRPALSQLSTLFRWIIDEYKIDDEKKGETWVNLGKITLKQYKYIWALIINDKSKLAQVLKELKLIN